MSDMQIEHTEDGECINLHSDKDISIMANNNEDITIVKNRTMNVLDGTNSETIKGNSSHTVQAGYRKVQITGGDYSACSTDAAANFTGKTSANIKGESAGVTVNGNGGPGVQIDGKGATGVKVTGSPSFDATGVSKAIITSPDVDIGNDKIVIHGSTSIELVVGGNSIKIDGGGVSINGQEVKISGTTINSSASGIHEITGGMVSIN